MCIHRHTYSHMYMSVTVNFKKETINLRKGKKEHMVKYEMKNRKGEMV